MNREAPGKTAACKTAVLVDYGAGNLTSVALAVRHVGWEPTVTSHAEDIAAADRVIFPGVGAAGAAMENLTTRGLDAALRDVLERGRPVLGICVGCQVIFDHSEEDGGTKCLGAVPGEVRRFRFPADPSLKVPHMGWNEVAMEREHPLLAGIPPRSQFYFVHSYYPVPSDDAVTLGRTTYGDVEFAAAVLSGNLAAVQFHTEKSGPPGLQLLRNFLQWKP
jgi:glutamine amidotransferase